MTEKLDINFGKVYPKKEDPNDIWEGVIEIMKEMAERNHDVLPEWTFDDGR